jgi:hypothetical protein
MLIHFEDLWEKCEKFHSEFSNYEQSEQIIDELILKLNLYKTVRLQNLSNEEKEKICTHTLGEVLLTLTNLSLHDNINVYQALNTALQYKSIPEYVKKYQK